MRPAELTPEQAKTKQRWLALLADDIIKMRGPSSDFLPRWSAPSEHRPPLWAIALCTLGAIAAGVAIYLATVVAFSL